MELLADEEANEQRIPDDSELDCWRDRAMTSMANINIPFFAKPY